MECKKTQYSETMHCTSLETNPHREGWEGEEKSNVRGVRMLLGKLKLRLLWAMLKLYSISKRYHCKPDNQIKAIVQPCEINK